MLMLDKTIHTFALASALAVLGTNASAQELTGSFERVFDVGEPLDLEVEAHWGNITVRSGPAGRVRIVGEIEIRPQNERIFLFWRRDSGLDPEEAEDLVQSFESDPPVELTDGRLRVGYTNPDWRRGRGYSIDYEIEVPAATNVRSQAGAGRQTIAGLAGRIEASTGSGRLNLTDLTGTITARTGSGGIDARGIAGDFEGATGSGSIMIEQAGAGTVRVTTGSGRIEAAGLDGALTARTGSGGMTIEGRPAAPWHLETGSGGITLRLPPDAAFDLEAHAGSGGISTDHPMTIRGRVERGRLQGQAGGGGAVISARTGSGGISIEQGAAQ
jgi:hypothetical protein